MYVVQVKRIKNITDTTPVVRNELELLFISLCELEIVMNELRKLRMSADFFCEQFPYYFYVSRSVKCYFILIANMDITLQLSKPGGPLVTLF